MRIQILFSHIKKMKKMRKDVKTPDKFWKLIYDYGIIIAKEEIDEIKKRCDV